ncbi:MAG: nucleoside 2-deoxyribosyltransferase [Candidatus Marinimicrobia bacterium]|nr:nucleoside 2-deoxyribosyltransferase [Candidatus Neomarinimicrobiota bacterium]
MSGGRGQAHLYPRIIDHLRLYGDVLSEFVADKQTTRMGTADMTPAAIYQRDIRLIDKCDLVVAEVTTPSLGVGAEVAYAGFINRPVLALYQPREGFRLSAMIEGDRNVTVVRYHKLESALAAVDDYFSNGFPGR